MRRLAKGSGGRRCAARDMLLEPAGARPLRKEDLHGVENEGHAFDTMLENTVYSVMVPDAAPPYIVSEGRESKEFVIAHWTYRLDQSN